MLREQFLASVGPPTGKPPDPSTSSSSPSTPPPKDASISLHPYQPPSAQPPTLYKKSLTPPNSLAANQTHLFAAQSTKAVVHVYSRERGSHDATIPFPERITSLCLACDGSVLALGSAEGNLFLWELGTGRLVTAAGGHLRGITSIVADPSGGFLLTASKDGTVRVWGLGEVLVIGGGVGALGGGASVRVFEGHRGEVTGMTVGHGGFGANFAVSVGADQNCFVWDYRAGNVLRQFLLAGTPRCVVLDPADRAAYIGFEDGDVQMLDLLASPVGGRGALWGGGEDVVLVEPSKGSRWGLPEKSHGAALSVDVSFDGTMVLTGHESGSILNWDVARQSFSSVQTTSPLPGPVTNLFFLPVLGFQRQTPEFSGIRIPEVVKPKLDAFRDAGKGLLPDNYAFNVQFADRLFDGDDEKEGLDFERALSSSVFPEDLLDEGLNELASWGQHPQEQTEQPEETTADFMALDVEPQVPPTASLEEENANLKLQLEALRRVQMASLDRLDKLCQERDELLRREQKRRISSNGREANGTSGDLDSDD